MLSINRCRQLLASAGHAMTDAQVERLRDQLYGLADITVSIFLERKDASRIATQARPDGSQQGMQSLETARSWSVAGSPGEPPKRIHPLG